MLIGSVKTITFDPFMPRLINYIQKSRTCLEWRRGVKLRLLDTQRTCCAIAGWWENSTIDNCNNRWHLKYHSMADEISIRCFIELCLPSLFLGYFAPLSPLINLLVRLKYQKCVSQLLWKRLENLWLLVILCCVGYGWVWLWKFQSKFGYNHGCKLQP